MEFGRVDPALLNTIDFTLPNEPEGNTAILQNNTNNNTQLYIGCAKWGRTEWVGKIYPPKTKEKDFLEHYVQHYNCIELNATHYKIYGEVGIAKWAAKAAGKPFLFCPKMYQGVTHRGSLMGKDFIQNEFFRGIVAFKEHLGPVFIQVSDAFSPKRKEELFTYLSSLPKDISFFVEVRHPQWFSNTELLQELLVFLQLHTIGFVITDTAGRRDCCHMNLTVSKAFIRYVGNSLHATDYTRIDAWIDRMKYWIENGINDIYFFMHMHDETFSPELTVYLIDKLQPFVKNTLIKPQFISTTQQATMF